MEVIPLREHGYFEGAQHTKTAQYRLSSCDTSVVFMQSASGRREHPVTREALTAMRAAFAPRGESKREKKKNRRRERGCERGNEEADGVLQVSPG